MDNRQLIILVAAQFAVRDAIKNATPAQLQALLLEAYQFVDRSFRAADAVDQKARDGGRLW